MEILLTRPIRRNHPGPSTATPAIEFGPDPSSSFSPPSPTTRYSSHSLPTTSTIKSRHCRLESKIESCFPITCFTLCPIGFATHTEDETSPLNPTHNYLMSSFMLSVLNRRTWCFEYVKMCLIVTRSQISNPSFALSPSLKTFAAQGGLAHIQRQRPCFLLDLDFGEGSVTLRGWSQCGSLL
ncbi:hypothetical protein FF2_006862 [Malus domestica]